MEKPIRDILLDTVPDPHIQIQWARQLRTAEAISERHTAGVDTVLLADEVGMGKTYVALAALSHYVFQTEANDRKVLLVVPPNNILSRKWEQDIRTFNESYLQPSVREGNKPGGGKRLRHLVIKTYWDLIQNLHDFKDQDLERISEGQIQCFALSLWIWNEKQREKGKRRAVWNAYQDMEDYSPEYLGFCSDFSQHALFDFLDREKESDPAGMRNLILNLNGKKLDQTARLKHLLRKFGRNQDSYESNVFIIGMAALRKTRVDVDPSKLLNTYIVGMALRGRHRPTREAILKGLEGANLLVERDKGGKRKNHCDWVEDLGHINLWGLQEDVRAILDSHKSSLKDIQEAVISRKLRNAGIDLAVVDEVHNWKNGGNGAENFQMQYAPYIAKKLLLSATPFQIHEAELGKVFGFACGPESRSMAVIDGLLGESGSAKVCLEASAGFLKRWGKLNGEDLALLQRIQLEASSDVGAAMAAQAHLWNGNEAMENFASQVCVYREAIAGLQRELSKVMIRHTKDRDKRHFHAGAEYRQQGRPDYDKIRRALYDVPGFGDTENALINFLAMRVDQLVRRDKAEGSHSNVHLMGGITSSNQAFRDSNKSLLNESSLSGTTREYLKFFESSLLGQDHPKVKVSVERAYQNYRRGRKTLIFCERVGTLAEIVASLNKRITTQIFGDEGLESAKDLRK
jgi:hypothetical protein